MLRLIAENPGLSTENPGIVQLITLHSKKLRSNHKSSLVRGITYWHIRRIWLLEYCYSFLSKHRA